MPAEETWSSVKSMLEHGQRGVVVLVDAMMASTYGCNTVGVCQYY